MPSWDDILYSVTTTTGIEEHLIDLPGSSRYRLCDVSRSGGRRPVWARFFEDGEYFRTAVFRAAELVALTLRSTAAAIIYLIDTSAFDKPVGKSSNQVEVSFRQLVKLRKDPMLRKVNIHVLL